MNEQQREFCFVDALPSSAKPAQFPFKAQEALSLYARRKGQKWLRVEAARALRLNARSATRAGHDESAI
jgi:hypothetical protein